MVSKEVDLRKLIQEYPDFPKQGVLFRDINPVLRNAKALDFIAEEFKNRLNGRKIDLVVGIESRGFIIATAIALKFQVGLVVVRKAGKLPGQTIKKSYEIEYGSAIMEMQVSALDKNQAVLVADDLIATGGTAMASAKIIEELGSRVVGFAFLVELGKLRGGMILRNLGYNVISLAVYN
ncbi:MAG: adenine phosphoribosyltransferase [Nitrososphaeraceae archaeon]|jgi:adenine phosphoribosyltransferase